MTDPYKVLGVSPDATDDRLKDAYRELARKYHPDNFVNNPLSDLAGEKMQEVNDAYDEIQRQRRQAAESGGAMGQAPSHFADIRRLINAGRVAEAEELIDGVPAAQRGGEWYFLKGSICYTRGWLDQALTNFTKATELAPQNQEYKAALNQLLWQRQNGYSRTGGGYAPQQQAGCGCCDMCAAFYCANCVTRCCCGSGC